MMTPRALIKRMLTAKPNQSFTMTLAINVVTVFFACAAAVSGEPTAIPRGKVAVYKFVGEVQAATSQSVNYESPITLDGTLYVKKDNSYPTLENAYYAVFADLQFGQEHWSVKDHQYNRIPISNDDLVMEEPFLMVYDNYGKLLDVKFPPNEAQWSKNIKISLASLLQLDWLNLAIYHATDISTFPAKEETVHGQCWVDYEISAKDKMHPNVNEITVKKHFLHERCIGDALGVFQQMENTGPQIEDKVPFNVASESSFDIERQGEDALIKKVSARGRFNYLPWSNLYEERNVLLSANFTLGKFFPEDSVGLPFLKLGAGDE